MKKQACLFGILCLIGVQCQLHTSVFADAVGENLVPQIAIEDFVRSLHPHGVSMTSTLQYKSDRLASQRENVRKLLEMLKNEDDKPFRSNAVVMLGIIAEPPVVLEILKFIEELEKKPHLDNFDLRALSSAVWALGILINQAGDTGSAHDELEKASQFLIMKSQGKNEKTFDQQQGFLLPAHQPENGNSKGDSIRRAAILGSAFANTEETKRALEKIYRDERDPRFRKFLEQVMLANQEIEKVGLLCYREPKSPSCQKKQKGLKLPKKTKGGIGDGN